jgi:hypothetical protein
MNAEIPDRVARREKSVAAERGISLRAFVAEALQDKLKSSNGTSERPWMKHMGKLRHLHKETMRINKLIKEAFE